MVIKKFLKNLAVVVLLALPGILEAGEDEDYTAIKNSFNDGFYALTLDACNAFLRKNTESSYNQDVLLIKGLVFFNLKKHPQAADVFESLKNSEDRRIREEAILYLAELHALSLYYDKSTALLEQLMNTTENNNLYILSGHRLGLNYFQQKKYLESARVWQEVLNRENVPDDICSNITHNLVKAYLKIGDAEQAQKLIESGMDKNSANYYFFDAQVSLSGKKHALSIEKFNKIIAGEFPVFWQQRAGLGKIWAYIELGQHREAEGILFNLENSIVKELEEELSYLKPFLFYRKSEFSPAIRHFQRFVNKYENSDWYEKAFLELVECYYSINKLQQAENLALQFLKKPPSPNAASQMHHILGWIYYKGGDLQKAISEFEWVALNSKNKDLKISSLCRVGDLLAEMGRLDEAMEQYNIILKDHQDSLYAEYAQAQLGIYLFEKGEYDSSILALSAAIKNFPKSSLLDKIRFYLTQAYFKKGDYALALNEADSFLALYPASSLKEKVLQQKAVLLYNLGSYQEAEQLIKNLSDMADYDYFHFMLAKIYLHRGAYDLAEQEYLWLQEKLDDPKKLAYLYLHKGELGFYLERWDKAYLDFQNAYNLAKEDKIKDQALYWQGLCFYRKKDFQKAVNLFKDLQDSSNLSREARYNLADILTMQGEEQKAIEVLEAIVGQGGQYSRMALLKLGDVYKKSNRHDKAIAAYKKLEANPYDIVAAEASFKIAEIYEIDGKTEESILQYLVLSTLYSHEISFVNKARIRCARLLEKADRLTEAEKIYREVSSVSSEEAIYAQERLKHLEAEKTGR
ncbi:MAG: tetratricopeptide repeat protein [Candidatus Omnitrophica bacterium]|nr:tetratricopeptide repeat protein [Candidatus Omnitrophota bacterium]